METTTLNQIIESGGLILAPALTALIGFYFYTKHIKTRNSIVNEEEMLLDIYFLRELIEKYKSHCMAKETRNHYITFRDEVKGKLSFDVPDKSTKSYVRGRLKHLSKEKEEIAKVLDKIQSLG
ncbi:MAG: hypothetical protein HOG34_00910 [Bacteroidetes bacterium]|nr:hypothetical protein [Bacteroidota bacterium]